MVYKGYLREEMTRPELEPKSGLPLWQEKN